MKRSLLSVGTLALVLAVLASSLSAQALKFPAGKKYVIGMAAREITNDYNRDIIAGAKKVIEAAGRNPGRDRWPDGPPQAQ